MRHDFGFGTLSKRGFCQGLLLCLFIFGPSPGRPALLEDKKYNSMLADVHFTSKILQVHYTNSIHGDEFHNQLLDKSARRSCY